MPELPEVETVMRGMRARLEGRVIRRADVRRADLRWALPDRLADRLRGRRVESFRRRAKYIFMRLDGGDSVLLHLGMSGRITLRLAGGTDQEKHEHVVLETDDGWEVAFIDPRRFGWIDVLPTAGEDSHVRVAGLGPEPLEAGFTGPRLKAALRGRRTSIKAALLDQRVVAGLGNIYVCEALFRARLSPFRMAGDVPTRSLVREIKATLLEAIAAGGSTLRDYVQPGGELGYFQHAWQVYGRQGKPCPGCPGTDLCEGIARAVQAGRSTFFCPLRQR